MWAEHCLAGDRAACRRSPRQPASRMNPACWGCLQALPAPLSLGRSTDISRDSPAPAAQAPAVLPRHLWGEAILKAGAGGVAPLNRHPGKATQPMPVPHSLTWAGVISPSFLEKMKPPPIPSSPRTKEPQATVTRSASKFSCTWISSSWSPTGVPLAAAKRRRERRPQNIMAGGFRVPLSPSAPAGSRTLCCPHCAAA